MISTVLLVFRMFGCFPLTLRWWSKYAELQLVRASFTPIASPSDKADKFDRSGHTCDIISAIWNDFVGNNSHLSSNLRPDCQLLRDFDLCMILTDLALSKGCDIEATIPWNSIVMPLFQVFHCEKMDHAHPSAAASALQYLMNSGYDKEERNNIEQTPLLFAAQSHQPHAIKCLKMLITRNANWRATDIFGRGALHTALESLELEDPTYQ